MKIELDIKDDDFNRKQKALLDLQRVRSNNRTFFDEDDKALNSANSKLRTGTDRTAHGSSNRENRASNY